MTSKKHLVHSVHTRIKKARETHQALAGSNYLAYNLSYVPIPLLAGILARIGKDAIARVMPVSTCFSNVGSIPTKTITFGKVTPLFFSGSLPFMPGLGVVATAAGMRDLISLALAHSKHGFDKERFLGYVKEFLFTRVAFSRRY